MSKKSLAVALVLACLRGVTAPAKAGGMPWVRVAEDKKGFVLEPSGRRFVPWGFNYGHDDRGRLIEDYWQKEWDKVEAHFAQMKKLGANVASTGIGWGLPSGGSISSRSSPWTRQAGPGPPSPGGGFTT